MKPNGINTMKEGIITHKQKPIDIEVVMAISGDYSN